jgi:hypothetical protein
MPDCNPALRPWEAPLPSKRAAAGSYETYDTVTNLVWQTRATVPSAYEDKLADALMAAFDDGAHDLAGVVARLNAMRVHAADGSAWTEAALAAELKRLGA